MLVIALLVAALLALGIGSYLSLNLTTARLARQSYQQNASFHLAEAGAEEALWSFNRANTRATDAWDGWSTRGTAAWREFTGFDFGGNTTGRIKVYVDNTAPAGRARPTAVALATVSSPATAPSSRMIEVTLARRSYFANGIVAKDTVRFAGLNATVDSWNSDPDHDPATAAIPYGEGVRNDRGSIATTAVQNSAMLVNQAAVWGYVATGGAAPEVGVNGSIRGRDTPADVRIDPGRVTTDFTADLPLQSAPVDGTPLVSIGATLGTAGQATKWRCLSLSLQGNQTLTILGDVTLVLTATTGSALEVTGNASIIIPAGSSLTLYAACDVKLAGNGLANGNARPATFRLVGVSPTAGGQQIQIAGNGALLAAVYAPNADVKINGNGDVMGGVVGQTVTFTGNAAFHYDESLGEGDDSAPFRVVQWRELASAGDRARWDAAFAGW